MWARRPLITQYSLMRIDQGVFLLKVSIVNNHSNAQMKVAAIDRQGRGQMHVEKKSIVVNEHSLIGSFRRWDSNDPVNESTEDARKPLLISTSCSRDGHVLVFFPFRPGCVLDRKSFVRPNNVTHTDQDKNAIRRLAIIMHTHTHTRARKELYGLFVFRNRYRAKARSNTILNNI